MSALRLFGAAVAIACHVGWAAADETGPQPPCGGAAPFPSYASSTSGAGPVTESWARIDWRPPDCLGWPQARYPFVIALAGRIEEADANALRERLGAVSTTRGMRYWSVTEGAWRVLIEDAAALVDRDGARRADFAPAELTRGATLYFVEQDNRSSSPVRFAMHVLEATPDRVVVETENVTPIKALLVTLFPPGTLRAAYIMTRMGAHTWGFYAISAASQGASGLVAIGKSSYENRARAFFEHLAAPTR